jgi:prophage antirepressor-like protein
MNQLTIFNYEHNEVRMFEIDGEPWFVLKDVCDILELSSSHKVAERLDEDERNLVPLIDSLGRQQETTVVSESGVYNVIFRSDKPEAKPFRRWVTHEVLPAIRKTGKYDVRHTELIEPAASKSAKIIGINRIILDEITRLSQKGINTESLSQYTEVLISQAEQEFNADFSWLKSINLAPEVPKLESKLYTIGQLCMEYSIETWKINRMLEEKHLIHRVSPVNTHPGRYLPTTKAIEEGLAIMQYDSDGHHPQVFWTVKGRDAIDDIVGPY